MSAGLIWDNLVTYSLQIGLLVGLAAFVPTLLRLRLPGAKLAYWQILLAACLLLPVVRPWRQAVATDNVQVTTTVVAVQPDRTPPARTIPPSQAALALLAAGAVARLGWLAVGLWRLRRYRRHSRPWDGICRLSAEVASPVTFGFRRPVILLPARFPEFDRQQREVILCHERLHIERHDWLFTMVEELIRAVFWFHPAIWWLLGEIQLAREQAVDRGVVERTKARDEYVDALLAIAGGGAQPDLAPAPLFLKRRHLKQRVVSILKEVRMSRTRWISGLAAALGILVAACWLVTATFPLAASPQVVVDAPGVTVDVGGTALMHRTPVAYPEAARRNGVQGTVSVEAKLDGAGNVVDARVLSGPDELRKQALMSVFQWHFVNSAAGTTRIVNIAFQLPAGEPQKEAPVGVPGGVVGGVPGGVVGGVPGGVRGGVPGGGVVGGIVGGAPTITNEQRALAEAKLAEFRAQLEQQRRTGTSQAQIQESEARIAALEKAMQMAGPLTVRMGTSRGIVGRTVKTINVNGLSDQLKSDLLAKLPVRAGGTLTEESARDVLRAVREFDEHLAVMWGVEGDNDAILSITAPGTMMEAPQRIKIGGTVQQAKLIKQVKPVYPPDAKAQGVEGPVSLSVLVAKDGTVQSIEVISGHPLLVPAALEAVRQWVYQTTLLNGNPVEVQTQVDVNFTLMK